MSIKRIDLSKHEENKKHEITLNAFDELDLGEQMILINNGDPREIFDELIAGRDAKVDIEHVKEGPDQWESIVSKRFYNFI